MNSERTNLNRKPKYHRLKIRKLRQLAMDESRNDPDFFPIKSRYTR